MSGANDALALKPSDVEKLLAVSAHIGSTNLNYQMRQYSYTRKKNGVHIIDVRKTWEKLLLAARVIAAVENPGDVSAVSVRVSSQRAILKYTGLTGASMLAGRYTSGTFTNQIQPNFREPRLIIVADPRVDHQAVFEAAKVGVPVIAFCNTDAALHYVDIVIPCNNKSYHSIGVMWWMLAREVLRIRGVISRDLPWDVMPDIFFYRTPRELKRQEIAMRRRKPRTTTTAGVHAITEHTPFEAPTVPEVAAPAPAAPSVAQPSWGGGEEEDWA